MDYTILALNKKLVVGVSVRTNNQAKDMPDKISSVWQNFYQFYFHSIPNQTSGKGLGIYTDYAGGHLADYTMLAAVEVLALPKSLLPPLVSFTIPSGTYAKFELESSTPTAVSAFWQELWAMPLRRTFSCDFEEYMPIDATGHTAVSVYIAIQ